MEKKSPSVKSGPRVKKVTWQRLLESTQWPSKEKVISSVDHGNDVVPQKLPHFSVNLCFPNEDMAEIRRKYEVLRPSPVTSPDYFKKLGFGNGYDTLMYVSDKKAKFLGKSLYSLGRSCFKEGVTKEDKCVSKDMHRKEKCHRIDDDELKGYLKEFVEQAKAAKVLAGMARKQKKTLQKQVLPISPAHSGKRKLVPRKQSLDDILAAIDQEWDSVPLIQWVRGSV